jgi:hypothetical protein
MVDKAISAYMSVIGSKGGRKSRRQLDSMKAKEMVRLREARKAFKAFHATCFWSNPKDYTVTAKDLDWIIDQLKQNGGPAGWERADKLCR